MRKHRRGRAFTLVELLVVIGIIALLIAILFPVILRVRTQAQTAACMSNQRQMYQAITICQLDHKGLVPQTGWTLLADQLVGWPGGNGAANKMIPDMEQVKRRYLCFTGKSGQEFPAPMTVAMAYYMGMTKNIGTYQDIEALFLEQSYRKVFQCPADSDPPAHWTMHWLKFDDDDILEPTSYGYNTFLSNNRFSRVWHPHDVAFFMDINATKEANGNQDFCRHWQGASFFDVWDNLMLPSNLALRPGEPWARRRHGGRINVMFCDGHVQTFMLPPDDIRAHQGECGHVSMSRDVFGPDLPDSHLD